MKKFKKLFYINQFSYTSKMIYILDFFIFQTLIQEKLFTNMFLYKLITFMFYFVYVFMDQSGAVKSIRKFK